MASPPYGTPATSPPLPPHITASNPKKRPSLSTPSHGPNLKRQKRTSTHSTTSALSNHPLRQTSFPPEESALDTGARSPSIESDFTAVTGGKSVVTNTTGKRGRGKGKKKVDGGARSTTGREKTADAGREETGEAPEDEEDEDEGGEGMVDDGEVVDREADVKKMALLMGAFNADQTERYTMLRRAKLRKETVRKIVNQTVSQSVPPAVITTINGYTKTFIGTLIERAREVQSQWASLDTPPLTPPKISIDPTDFHAQNPKNDVFTASSENNTTADNTTATQGNGEHQVKQAEGPRELGPLLPDHFREALRRYKRDGEGGGVGLTGVSVGLGTPGSGSARLGGKRMFR